MLKVLYISKYFPPAGGAGVQRAIKFTKNLPQFGILPVVLTEKPDFASRWSPMDSSMTEEILEEIPVFQVDLEGKDQVSRKNAYVDAALQAFKEHRFSAIFVSMEPFDDCQIAEEVAKRLELPWIADLRDPWALDEFHTHKTWLHRKFARKNMGESLQGAASIIMNTPEAAESLKKHFPKLAGRVDWLTNGYDQKDFTNKISPRTDDKFRIVHTGAFHTARGLRQQKRMIVDSVLGRTTKGAKFLGRSPFYLIQAIERLVQENPALRKDFRIQFAGQATEADQSLVNNSNVGELIEFLGYLSHQQSVDLLRSADLLFLPMHQLAENQRCSIVPGKVYEYIASETPILAAVPDGDAKDFLNQLGNASICAPNDVNGISNQLRSAHRSWQNRTPPKEFKKDFIEQFERTFLTRKLAKIIASTTGVAPN